MMNSVLNELQRELAKLPCDRDDKHLVELLQQLGQAFTAECLPVVDAICRHYPNAEVRAAARQAASTRVFSLQALWDGTVVDQTSTIESRAERLAGLNYSDLTPLEVIQAIFNEMKGEPLAGNADPRLAPLKDWLEQGNPQISTAVSFAIARSYCNRLSA